jgi:hypothetical protein
MLDRARTDLGGPIQSGSVASALQTEFVRAVQGIPGVEQVWVREEAEFIRICTVIPDVDLTSEDAIYEAQAEFLRRFPDVRMDFSVVYRQGRESRELTPRGARSIYPA